MRLAPAAKAVLYGVLVDVGGSIGAGLVLALLYAMALAGSGASAQEIELAVSEPEPTSWFSLLGFVVGCSASFLGGYVCARVAPASELRMVSVVAAISGLVSLLMGSGAYGLEWNAVLALAGMGAVLAGGWTGMRSNARRSE